LLPTSALSCPTNPRRDGLCGVSFEKTIKTEKGAQ
jgi:hypothetical protein